MNEENKIFHGGCLECTSQRDYGMKRCDYCQYQKADWDKPDLSINEDGFHLGQWISENKAKNRSKKQHKNLKSIKIKIISL